MNTHEESRRPLGRFGVAAIVALLGAATIVVPAIATNNLNASWKDVPSGAYQNYIRYYFHSSVPTSPTSFRTRIVNGAATWNSAQRELFFSQGTSSNKLITITYEDLAFPNGDALAISMTFAGACLGDICTGSMAYNSTPSIFHFYTGTSTPNRNNNEVDLWSVAAHEFGHQVSLTHPGLATTFEFNTMYEEIDVGTIYARDRHSHDTEGINALYPPK